MKKKLNNLLTYQLAAKIWSISISLVAIFSIFLLFYYIFYPSRGEFHSDSTDTIMWAQAAIDAKGLFNRDFTYAATLPFGGHLIMIPFVLLFGVSMKAHILGMFTFAVLFIIAVVAFCRSMKWSVPQTALMIINLLLILSLSPKLREIFWGHIIYYSLGIFFLLIGMSLIFHTINAFDKSVVNAKLIILITLSSLWFILTSTNGLQSLIIFALPAAGGVFLERYFNTKKKLLDNDNLLYFLFIFIILLSIGMGLLLGKFLIGENVGGYANAYSTFSAPNKWVENFQRFLTHWISLLGVDIKGGESFTSKASIKSLILIIFSLFLVVIPFIITKMYHKFNETYIRILIFTHWIMTILIMIGYVFGNLSAANWRLSPLVASSTILSVVFIKYLISHIEYKRFGVLLLIFYLLISGFAAKNIINIHKEKKQNEQLYSVAQFLEDNDLSYGFATFWNANALTVISDSKVKVRSIVINSTDISPYYYQSQKNWYTNQPKQNDYFLLLTQYEYTNIAKNKTLMDKAINKLEQETYIILVFDEYIIENLSK